jgi:hypothetical protein
MWVRIVVILISVVFIITGCNSLMSQFFGTHKLRSFAAGTVATQGLGDADFVEIIGVWRTGDYLIVPPKNQADKPLLIYPILSDDQLERLDTGEVIKPLLIAWTKDFDPACDETHTCANREEINLKGIIRKPNPQKDRAGQLPKNRYAITEDIVYIEAGRAPLAWYWNLAMLLGGIGLIYSIERKFRR